jgi:predicted nucleic acid-binding protein
VTGFLLDTNVVSELNRPRPSEHVLAFLAQTPIALLFLSDIVIAEIRFGIESTGNAARRKLLSAWLDQVIRPIYAGRILPLGESTLLQWRLMLERCRKQGTAVAEPDLLLAATAAEHGLTIVTRDTMPFRRLDLPVLDPWTAQASSR